MNQPADEPYASYLPAAQGLPDAALDSARNGATMIDAWAETPNGQNFLAHALVQLARDGWLRAEPDTDAAFDPADIAPPRPAPEPTRPDAPAAAPAAAPVVERRPV